MRYAHSLGSMSSAKMEGKLKKPLDYINIILQIIEHLLSWSGPENEASTKMPYLVIESTNKVQRAYIIKSDQIVSFAFPFQIYNKKDGTTGYSEWHVRYKDIDINTTILSKSRELYSDYEAYQNNKSYSEIASAQNLSDTDILKAIRLFEMLMITEPAYFRYDYDPKGAKGLKHPLCHLDCNFIDEHHYKVGLHNRINFAQIEDFLDKDTDSWFIAKYKESVIETKKRFKIKFAKIKKSKGVRKYNNKKRLKKNVD